jgi:hypothetical protein
MRTFAREIGSICFVVVLSLSAWAANRTVDCSGGTPGAFTSLQKAIDSLNLLGPHQITVLTATPCVENVQLVNRQRLTITAPQGNLITSAAGNSGDVMTISSSTGIIFTSLGFAGGSRGVVIDRASEVTIQATTIQANAFAGIRIDGNSTVALDGLIQNNGGSGIVVNDSTITVGGGTQILNNSFNGVALTRSRGQFQAVSVQGNSNGVLLTNASSAVFLPTNNILSNAHAGLNVVNGSSIQIFAPNFIQNNGKFGMNISDGSSARVFGDVASDGTPLPNVIEGNPFIGLNIDGGQVVLFDANQIRNNGSGGQPFRAGVRVDDNGSFITSGSSDIQITGNNGPGIDATTGGNVDLTGTIVTNNSEDGIRLQGNAQLSFFPPNTNVVNGNAGKSVNCDSTSVFFGDPSGVTQIACHISHSATQAVHPQRRLAIEKENREFH